MPFCFRILLEPKRHADKGHMIKTASFQNPTTKKLQLILLRSILTLWQCAAKVISAFLIFAVLVLKSDNTSMSYGQKSDFQDGGRRHLDLNF